jgi:carbon storage regulator
MLTLTRREGESIAIGDDIEITIVDVGRGKVRVGIVAPRHLAILRSEVLGRIVEENQRAAGALSPKPEDGAQAGRIVFDHGLPGLRDHHAFILADVPGFPRAAWPRLGVRSARAPLGVRRGARHARVPPRAREGARGARRRRGRGGRGAHAPRATAARRA